MLLIIGVDGATFSVIDEALNVLPTFRYLKENFNWGILKALHLHSAASWISIFTGVPHEEHKITEFWQDGRWVTREDLKHPLVWEILEQRGFRAVALGIPMFAKPVTYNCELSEWLPVHTWAITEEEMERSDMKVLEESLKILSEQPDFFATVFSSLDRVQHIFWHDRKRVIQHYVRVDRYVGRLLEETANFLILSDHGFKGGGKGIEDHDPNGIVITNLPETPKTVLDVTPIILKYFKKRC